MEENLVCEQTVIHKEEVEKVKKQMLTDDLTIDLAEFFKVFSDSTRVKILDLLRHENMCVCDIAYAINMTQSAISHQLKILKQAKIVKYNKVGKVVYYMLDDEHINEILEKGVEHLNEI